MTVGGCSFTFKIELRLRVDLARVDEGFMVGVGETVSVCEDTDRGVVLGVEVGKTGEVISVSFFVTGLEIVSTGAATMGGSFSIVGVALTGSGSNSIFFLSLLQEKSCC